MAQPRRNREFHDFRDRKSFPFWAIRLFKYAESRIGAGARPQFSPTLKILAGSGSDAPERDLAPRLAIVRDDADVVNVSTVVDTPMIRAADVVENVRTMVLTLYRLIGAAQVAINISTFVESTTLSEAQARELVASPIGLTPPTERQA